MKFFNTAGPINPADHYCVPFERRLDVQLVQELIEQKKYFVLHAPRQTGKTTALMYFVHQINSEGRFTALYLNVEAAQAARSDYLKGMSTILSEMLSQLKIQLPQEKDIIRHITELTTRQQFSGSSLATLLQEWAHQSKKPIVLFIDEIDSLVGDTLISVLRQLRSGYAQRPRSFPQSICLTGVRDVRDYRIWSEEAGEMILSGSAFNIKAESLRMRDFTSEEVRFLYNEHTHETGQRFNEDALDAAFTLTQGQPWLVNALAYEACFRIMRDRQQPITQEIIEIAKENLIKRRDTHLDLLADRLQEPRVRDIIDAFINGTDTSLDFPQDNIQYVIDLGLVVRRHNTLMIANPIYQEVLPRELVYSTQLTMPQHQLWYVKEDGSIDMHKMLSSFTQFYRENSALWLEKFAYKESGPHLFTMAFLQRIINGGGKIHPEYALGNDRVDLFITWKTQRIVIEMKIWRSEAKTIQAGLEQTSRYMDTANATEGHLIVFDKRDKSWDEKIYTRVELFAGKLITIWGM